MTTNYTPPATETEEEDIFTQAFTQSNDPASVATSAAQREYSRILAESRAQERSTQESYSDMYAKMKQSAFRRRQATPSRGFTGGMEAQQQATLSAAEMAELGALGRSQEQALRDIRTGRLSAASNAMIVGQQQADYATMLQDRAFGTQQQIESIISDKDLSDEARTRLLLALGLDREEVEKLTNETKKVAGIRMTKSEEKQFYDRVASLSSPAGGFMTVSTPLTEREEE